ncbi:MAG: rod shape-determining protein MreD [Bacteroidota bacterium]|jgi:rod shape-determining protein MreD
MITDLIRNTLLFFTLLIVQVALFNNVNLGGYINPFVYVLFLLVLPVRIPGPALLLIAFVMGLVIDMFSNSGGMHAASSVFLAYLRPTILKFMAPREGYETESSPSIREFGLNWFILYASILVFLHHLMLFLIEVFRISEFLPTIARVFLSSVMTVFLIVIFQFLTDKSAMKK